MTRPDTHKPLSCQGALLLVCVTLPVACSGGQSTQVASRPAQTEPAPAVRPQRTYPLVKAKQGLRTTVAYAASRKPAPRPPADIFERVEYPAPLGDNVAYVSPVKPGTRRPGIIWLTGGSQWGIDAFLWQDAPARNDQTAAAFRKAGIVLMHPALRGSNENPGTNECMYGEVDDVIAAARYLATRSDIDPEQIYLGGHSTGGTLALLVAASTDVFRAVFAFGPVPYPYADYGGGLCFPKNLPEQEARLRSPGEFLKDVITPTWVIEGIDGNSTVFGTFERVRGDAPVRLVIVPGANHFDVLAPANEFLAKAILARTDFAQQDAVDLVDIAQAKARDGTSPSRVSRNALKFVRLTGVVDTLVQVWKTQADKICREDGKSAADCEDYKSRVSVTHLESLILRTFSIAVREDDLEQLVQFFSSPFAQKVVLSRRYQAFRATGTPVNFTPPVLTSDEQAELKKYEASRLSAVERSAFAALDRAVQRYIADVLR